MLKSHDAIYLKPKFGQNQFHKLIEKNNILNMDILNMNILTIYRKDYVKKISDWSHLDNDIL